MKGEGVREELALQCKLGPNKERKEEKKSKIETQDRLCEEAGYGAPPGAGLPHATHISLELAGSSTQETLKSPGTALGP